MSNKKQPHRQPPTQPADVTRPSMFSNTILLGMTGILGGLLAYSGWQYYMGNPNPPPVVNNSSPADQPSTPASPAPSLLTPADAQTLRGQWVRTDSDGNYILDIKSVVEDGKLDAAYLNPKPINVAKAAARKVDDRLRVFVELRDLNYPGSTYDLRYDAASDQLVGEYYQAGQQQRFQVEFARAK